MKKAIKAYSIDDKLYNLERIHSKIVTYTSPHFEFNRNLNLKELTLFLSNLHDLIECMGDDIKSKHIKNYLNAVKQTLKLAKDSKKIGNINLFNSCCYLHGSYTRFRELVLERVNRGCEINYQKVCSPLLILEIAIREEKLHNIE